MARSSTLFLLLLALAWLTGCASPPADRRFDPRRADFTNGYDALFTPLELTNVISPDWLREPTNFFRLGPGDVVDIKVLGDETTTTRTLVGPDGKIYFNLLPGVFVWGLKLSEVKTVLEVELAKEMRVPPSLSIVLRTVGSRRLWIMGQVQTPGSFDLMVPITLLEAIAAAGGLATLAGSSEITADLRNSFLIRGHQRIPVDIDRLIRKGDLSQNIYLQPEDFLFLAPSQVSDVFILGAVAQPGSIVYTEPMTLVRAIASAGGTVRYAYGSKVAIIRGSLQNPRAGEVDYKEIIKGKESDIPLVPGDIVYVPFVPYKKVAELAEEVLQRFVGTVALNEGRNAVDQGAAPVGVSVGVGTAVTPAVP